MSQTTYPVSLLDRQVTQERGLRQALRWAAMVLLAVAFLASLLLVVWTRQIVVQTAYAIQVENELFKALTFRQDALVSELKTLRSPGRLAPKARELGMTAPPNERVRRVRR